MFKIENHKQRLENVTGWVVDQNDNFVVAQHDGRSKVGDHLVNHGDHLWKQVGFFDAERVPALLQHASHHLRLNQLLLDWEGAKPTMMTPTPFFWKRRAYLALFLKKKISSILAWLSNFAVAPGSRPSTGEPPPWTAPLSQEPSWRSSYKPFAGVFEASPHNQLHGLRLLWSWWSTPTGTPSARPQLRILNKGRHPKKNRFFLGNSPKQRTPPTHP